MQRQFAASALQIVKRDDGAVGALLLEPQSKMRADETRAPRDQYSHLTGTSDTLSRGFMIDYFR
jgi:hypothetical protein